MIYQVKYLELTGDVFKFASLLSILPIDFLNR